MPLIGGSNRSFDVQSLAEVRYDRVVVGNLGRGPFSDNLPCALRVGVYLIYIHAKCGDGLNVGACSRRGKDAEKVNCMRPRRRVQRESGITVSLTDRFDS